MGGRHAAIERHNHEDIDACQQCLDNGKPRYRRFVEHRCSTRPCHTGRRTRHCSVHHLGHPVTRSFPLRMRHPQRQPHRRTIPQFSRRLFHTLMYEIISITSLGRTDGLLPSVSYADSSPRRGEPSIANPLIRYRRKQSVSQRVRTGCCRGRRKNRPPPAARRACRARSRRRGS